MNVEDREILMDPYSLVQGLPSPLTKIYVKKIWGGLQQNIQQLNILRSVHYYLTSCPKQKYDPVRASASGNNLGMRPANERRRYNVTLTYHCCIYNDEHKCPPYLAVTEESDVHETRRQSLSYSASSSDEYISQNFNPTNHRSWVNHTSINPRQ